MSEIDNKLEKYTHHYWCEELKDSKEKRAELLETAERSTKVYSKKHKLADTEREMGIWWSLINTLLPAYFSRVPKVDVTQRRKRGGDIYRLAGLVWEYSTQYAIDEHFKFTDVGYRAVLQFLLGGEGILCARYESEFKDAEYEYPLVKGEDGSYKTEDGEAYVADDERAKVIESEDGPPMAQETIEELHKERAILEVISIKDYRCGTASSPEEIPWMSKRCYLSREQAKKKFGEDSDLFDFNSYPDSKATERKDKPDYEGKAEIWEIWCKTTRSVYFLHEGGKEKFLRKQEPPVDYQDFWPFVIIQANTKPDCITPFSDYAECEDLIIEAERLTTRIHYTIEFIRTNFAYDASMGDVIEKLVEGDLKGIPIQQSSAQRAKGSLGDSLFFLPIDPYIKALQSLYEAREQTLGKLYESLACSDLLRGQSVAIKTATANNLESNYASLRFSVRREQVARFLTDGIKKIGEIIATKFQPETIYEMSFAEELVEELPDPPPPPMPMQPPMMPPGEGMPPDPSMMGQAPMMPPPPPMPVDPFVKFLDIYEILKSSAMRNFKLDIESDSLVELDQAADRAERVDAMTSAGGFLQQLEPLLKSAPSTAKFAKGMMRFVLRTYKAGKDIEGDLMGALDSMIMELEQAKQNQKDPTEAQNQAFLQVEQMKAQLKDKEIMVDQAAKDIELQQANQKLMIDAQNAQGELQIKSSQIGANMQIAQMENSLKIEALKIEAAKLEQKNQEAAVQVQLKAMKEAFDQKMQDAYLKLDEFSVIAKENEKLIEEKRLASQERMETLKIISDQISQVNQMKQAQAVPAPSAPVEKAEKAQPVVVNLHTGGGKQREVVVKRSKDGSLVGRTREVEDDDDDSNE